MFKKLMVGFVGFLLGIQQAFAGVLTTGGVDFATLIDASDYTAFAIAMITVLIGLIFVGIIWRKAKSGV